MVVPPVMELVVVPPLPPLVEPSVVVVPVVFLPPVLAIVPPLPLVRRLLPLLLHLVLRRLLPLLLQLVEPVHLRDVVRARLAHVVVVVPGLLRQLRTLPELLLLLE